jgi:hypothetical protein
MLQKARQIPLRGFQFRGIADMREISHKLAFDFTGTAARSGDVFDPNKGTVQARVGFGDAALLDRAVDAAGLGSDEPATPRPRDVQVQATAGR